MGKKKAKRKEEVWLGKKSGREKNSKRETFRVLQNKRIPKELRTYNIPAKNKT